MYPSNIETVAAMADEDLAAAAARPYPSIAPILAALVIATERQNEILERLTEAVYQAGRDA